MKKSFSTAGPPYVPKIWDIVQVMVPGSIQPIYGMVVHQWGSNAQGKINVLCKSGPKASALHLIWKEKTGWFCWIHNAHYHNLSVIKYDGPLPYDLQK